MNELTIGELSELKSCETTIETTQSAFAACGIAIARIRDGKLYRRDFGTFEDYCQKRWGWTRQRAHQLIEAAEFVSDLPKSEQKEIENEYQARRLKQQKESVLNQKCKQSVDKNDKVINLDKTGYPIPDGIYPNWVRAETEGRQLLSIASQIKCSIESSRRDDDLIFREMSVSTDAHSINVYTGLKQIIPYAVCTSCNGHKPDRCVMCKGRGFFSEFLWKNAIPEEIKMIRQKSCSAT